MPKIGFPVPASIFPLCSSLLVVFVYESQRVPLCAVCAQYANRNLRHRDLWWLQLHPAGVVVGGCPLQHRPYTIVHHQDLQHRLDGEHKHLGQRVGPG